MEWVKKPTESTTYGCGVHLCNSRDENKNCSWDYCVVRACVTKFCYKDY